MYGRAFINKLIKVLRRRDAGIRELVYDIMGWVEGTVHLGVSGLYPGARMYAFSEGSATLKYAQIVAWLDLQRQVSP